MRGYSTEAIDESGLHLIVVGGRPDLQRIEEKLPANGEPEGTWQIIIHPELVRQLDEAIVTVLAGIRAAVEMHTLVLSEGHAISMSIALSEAFTNAAKHGNLGDPSKSVQIRWGVDATRREVMVIVDDEGAGFVPEEVPPLDDERQHGRGIALMPLGFPLVQFDRGGTRIILRRALAAATKSDTEAEKC